MRLPPRVHTAQSSKVVADTSASNTIACDTITAYSGDPSLQTVVAKKCTDNPLCAGFVISYLSSSSSSSNLYVSR